MIMFETCHVQLVNMPKVEWPRGVLQQNVRKLLRTWQRLGGLGQFSEDSSEK